MSKRVPIPPPGFDDLSMDEKIVYVHALWERLTADAEQVPVPQWHREVLAERLEDQRLHPEEERPWEQVRVELEEKLNAELP